MLVVEGVVAGQRLLARARAREDVADLVAAHQAEVQRGADALRGQRQAVAGGVAGEEDAVLGRVAQLVRDPVALEADGVRAQVLGQLDRVVLDVEAGVERADADPQLAAGGEAPAVARRHDLAVDPDRQVVVGAVGVDLQPARQRRVRRLVARVGGQVAAPAQRVHDQRRGQVAAVGVDRVAGAAVDLGGLERAVGLLAQQAAQLAVVERRERPRQRPVVGAERGRHAQLRRRSGGASPSGPAPRATPWGCRTPRSGARRSRSGRSSTRARGSRRRGWRRPAGGPRPGRRSWRRRSGRRTRRRGACARRRAWSLVGASTGQRT